ncbi:MAG: porin family protein [Ginsengibacter sp.]
MNKIFSLLFFIVTGLHSFGQNNIGFKFGMNVSNVKNSDGNNFKTLLSFNTGIVARLKLKDKFMLYTELLLSNKGFHSIIIPSGTTATKLAYFSVPVLLEYEPAKKFYFQLGPEFNFLINARIKNSRFNESDSESYNKFDLAVAGGVGFNVFRNFNLETRYSLGLSQIRKNENIFGSYNTRTFQVNLIYFLKSRK